MMSRNLTWPFSAISIPLVSLLLVITPLTRADSSEKLWGQCRGVPGSIDWPSQQSWAGLNQSLGGRLIAPTPPGSVCHPEEANYNANKCAALQAAWPEYEFHQDDPTSSMWNQFNNFTCLPFANYSCSPTGYPVYVVNATGPSHVKLAIDYARSNNIRLVVKATGHDFIGRSSGPFSLSIWTHHVKSIQHVETFQPQKCEHATYGPAVKLGAGTQLGDAYEALGPLNRTIVGGNCATVSVAGFLTGGGHSLLSPRYGMGADQVLEMEVVTPTGEIVVANECQNTDLFWALRGGGGSTFGVLTSVTVKTVPSPQIVGLLFQITQPLSEPDAQVDIMRYMLRHFPDLGRQNVSGYSYLYNQCPSRIRADNGTAPISCFAGAFALQDTANVTAITALFMPLFAHIKSTWPVATTMAIPLYFPNHLAWSRTMVEPNEAGQTQYVGSHLLDERALTSVTAESKQAFADFASVSVATAFLVGGRGVMDAVPAGGSNAVLPAWRKTYVHAMNGLHIGVEPLNRTQEKTAVTRLNESLAGIRKLAPEMGVYMNEGFLYEPNWQREFWGENYARLLNIKRKIDPDDILWCYPCVGSEGWEEVDGRLCQIGSQNRIMAS